MVRVASVYNIVNLPSKMLQNSEKPPAKHQAQTAQQYPKPHPKKEQPNDHPQLRAQLNAPKRKYALHRYIARTHRPKTNPNP